MSDIDFVKVSGGGNDFILIDNRNDRFPVPSSRFPDFVREVCQRKTSIGADGVLFLERSKSCDVKMRVFNPDGTEVEMCGNGARCVALWAKSKIKNQKSTPHYVAGPSLAQKLKIETKAGKLEAEVVGEDRVKLKMSDPKGLRLDFGLKVCEEELKVNYINTGVPHVVCFVDDLEGLDAKRLGSLLRHHPEFQPEGTNADFVRVIDEETIKVRTYERGVEDETLSCGTGVVASAIVSARLGFVGPPVLVETQGDSSLRVHFDLHDDVIRNVYLEGEARVIYEGRMRRR